MFIGRDGLPAVSAAYLMGRDGVVSRLNSARNWWWPTRWPDHIAAATPLRSNRQPRGFLERDETLIGGRGD